MFRWAYRKGVPEYFCLKRTILWEYFIHCEEIYVQGGVKRNRLDPRDRGRHPRDLGISNSLAPYFLQDNFPRYCHMFLNLLRIPWQEWCHGAGLEEVLVMPIALLLLLLLLLFLLLFLLDCAGSCLRSWPCAHHWRCHRGVTICKRDCRKAS